MNNKQKLLFAVLISSASTHALADFEIKNEEDAYQAHKASRHIEDRISLEKSSDENPFSLTSHKMNYILPYTYATNINKRVYSEIDRDGLSDYFTNAEAKFQMSVKFPVVKNVFHEQDHLYFGLTMKSFWQIYASGASRPFRTTDYNPELFYMTRLPDISARSNYLNLGIEHESNGETQYLSRSWNKVYAQFTTECDDYAISLKAWARLKEEEKHSNLDPDGDDNPDIGDYYGNAELTAVLRDNDLNYSFKGRHNLSTGKSYVEMGLTFPIKDNLRGYVQYVNGYGESLIDYNHFQRRIGIGIVFSDIL